MIDVNLCRLCGVFINTSDRFLIYETSNDNEAPIADIINRYMPIQVSDNDEYPKMICCNCKKQLEKIKTFFHTVKLGQSYLKCFYDEFKKNSSENADKNSSNIEKANLVCDENYLFVSVELLADENGIESHPINNYDIPGSGLFDRCVGKMVTQFLNNVVDLDLIGPSDIHLIGHSLGAHVFRVTGAAFTLRQIGRITGLNPAGPGFGSSEWDTQSLSSTNAQFVDVIHASAGSYKCLITKCVINNYDSISYLILYISIHYIIAIPVYINIEELD
ncbi:Lipase/vitellogenin,Zinc finger, AD-type,Alpha/Beta hydrolase fold [Cinara cedri]|uniref:Lipase/vitellogenin,Zinc finger, AD-type,Alpha/Beta hydrolase fold n=1 Tax=Cinara cedri TaxID=506608 RepID=A0A5E4MTZ5_9HEMI|nr:Lipase/vitellogenin,Zinc finger, AD-type,Alpha/Beta hydrolase fold [Cinara cedri]